MSSGDQDMQVRRTKEIQEILQYEHNIAADVENAIQDIQDRAKVLHAKLDEHVNRQISALKQTLQDEHNRTQLAIDKLNLDIGIKPTTQYTQEDASDEAHRDEYKTPMSCTNDNSRFNADHLALQPANGGDVFERKYLQFVAPADNVCALYEQLTGHFTLELGTPLHIASLEPPRCAIRPTCQQTTVKLVRKFKVGDDSDTVHAIAPVGQDQAWICCGWGSRTISLYDKQGHRRKSTTLDIQINDASTVNDANRQVVMISSYREKSIKRLNQESLRTSDFAHTPLFPSGICADQHSDSASAGGIYVCLRCSYQRQATFGSQRMVARLDAHGDMVTTIEKGEAQATLFGYPFRVAQNINGDICVSDYGDGTRAVVILDSDGKLKSCYRGQPIPTPNDKSSHKPSDKPSDKPFLPHGIACDELGRILVSDWNNDCVHVLDKDGTFLCYLLDSTHGIAGPNALGLDKRGYLWVGDSQGVVRIFKYSIAET